MAALGLWWIYLGVLGLRAAEPATWARRMFRFSMVMILALCVMVSVGPFLPCRPAEQTPDPCTGIAGAHWNQERRVCRCDMGGPLRSGHRVRSAAGGLLPPGREAQRDSDPHEHQLGYGPGSGVPMDGELHEAPAPDVRDGRPRRRCEG